jgi:Spy/CpxP family protein refolding chaperone
MNPPRKIAIVLAFAALACAAAAHAQHAQPYPGSKAAPDTRAQPYAGSKAAPDTRAQPYAGQDTREVKALSQEEVKQYLSGSGMGYARAAELNHYPGPMHVLELADELQLTAEQRQRTRALMDAHKSDARALGRSVVDAESALDALFRSSNVSEADLAAQVRAVAAAQGDYRLSHLETHRRTRALLTPEQIARYDSLRGYGAGGTAAAHEGHGKH